MAATATLVRSLNVGTLSSSRGCCPVCGQDVARTHLFNGARLMDRYGCYRCGFTEYTVSVGA